jgi:hypothetical protein
MVAPVTNVPFPAELAKELQGRAERAGMDLPTYLAYLARVDIRSHDPAFAAATRHLFKKFPESMRKLAE